MKDEDDPIRALTRSSGEVDFRSPHLELGLVCLGRLHLEEQWSLLTVDLEVVTEAVVPIMASKSTHAIAGDPRVRRGLRRVTAQEPFVRHLARERIAAVAVARTPLKVLGASSRTPGFLPALLALVDKLETLRVSPARWIAAARVGGGRVWARGLRRGSRRAV